MAKQSPPDQPTDSTPPTEASEPFIPQMCSGCAQLNAGACPKLRLHLAAAPDREIEHCGLFIPLTSPTEPAQE
jgi:hypothetical protein